MEEAGLRGFSGGPEREKPETALPELATDHIRYQN